MVDDYEYDFAYELGRYNSGRLVEQMEPKGFRTFRSEFNISSEHHSSYTTTTHYSTQQYVTHTTDKSTTSTTQQRSKDKYDGVDPTLPSQQQQQQPPHHHTKTNGTVTVSPVPTSWGTSMHFSEIRSLKRIHRVNEAIGTTEDIVDAPGIVHPTTGEMLTVGDAIRLRVLDVRTGSIVAKGGASVPIDEAARIGLIDPDLAERLLGPCSGADGSVSLLEAIQRELYDAAERGAYVGETSEKRIKVGESDKRPEAGPAGVDITEAMQRGRVDHTDATYLLENGTRIPISEAYERGHLVLREVRVKPGLLTLSDALARDLVDDRTGQIVDRNSGDRYQIDAALKHGLLDPDVREIVDPRSDTMVTLKRALETGVINRKSGKYVHAHEKISFREARRRRLIVKPMSLKDACDVGSFDARGTVASPLHRTRLSILEAVSRGVLDSDAVRSIVDTRTDELVTLSESLSAGIIRADTATFRDSLTGEVCSIPEAVDRGLIVSVSLKSIFDIDAFRDPHSTEYLSLNAALLKGLLSPKHGGSILADPSGRLAPIDEKSARDNLVKPNVLDMLLRPIGIFDSSASPAKELNVLESVLFGFLDPKTGQVVDPETRQTIPLNLAVEKRLITADGAVTLDSLLNIMVTIQSISKSVKRHVTITSSGRTKSEYTITFSEAVRRGLIDESTQTFQDPESGKIVSIQQALNDGLIDTESPQKGGKTVTKITSTLIIPPKTDNRFDARIVSGSPETMDLDEGQTTKKITRDLLETERTVQVPTSSMEKQVFELPPDGWFLAEAIDQKLFDPVTGLFIIPGTDRLVSFEECVDLQIINPNSAKVVDPVNSRYATLKRSLEKRILDKTGHYRLDPKGLRDEQITLNEAIVRNLVVLEDRTRTEPSNQRLIQITKILGRPDLVEVSNVLDKNPPTFVEVTSTGHDEPSRVEPVRLKQGLIYDPSTALVIDTRSGTSETLIEAIVNKKVDPETVKVKDPNSGKYMDAVEAIRKGIVDGNTGEYKDQSGRKISLSDAAKFGVLAVLGAPLIAAAALAKKGTALDAKSIQEFVDNEKQIRITKEQKISKTILIEDPRTGRQIVAEQALKEGLITLKDYENLEKQLGDPKTVRIVSGSESSGEPRVVSTLIIKDPKTGRELTPQEAIESGLITREELDEMRSEIPESEHVVETKTEIVSSSVVIKEPETGTGREQQRGVSVDEPRSVEGSKPKARKPTPAERTRSRVTTEPKYKVSIGCARRSYSQSPERDARPVVLQKMRKKVVRPKDAAAKGLIDKTTAEALENKDLFEGSDGEPMTLGEAVSLQKLDGSSGSIVDPQRGDTVNINEAMSRGILDPEGTTSQILVPLNRSLSVPELFVQGLIDPETCKIVHPETGSHLTLREAILCDIVDPLSGIAVTAPDNKITLQEAIDKGVVNEDRSTVKVDEGNVDLLKALQMNLFEESDHSATTEIPPAGMTFQVAVRRGLVDTERKEIVHPITGERKPVRDAIDNDFIMAIPVPIVDGSVKIDEALNMRLIDEEKGTFKDPVSGEVIPISQAVEQGLLIIKPMEHMRTVTDPNQSRLASVTETITSYHTITTKIVEILPGYVLVNSKEVRNVQTGELIPIETAKERGIVLDESETQEKFKTRKIKMSFSDAVRKGLIDMNKGTFMDPESGKVVSVSTAIKDGLIDPEKEDEDVSEKSKPKVSKLNLIEGFDQAFDESTQKFVDPEDPGKRLSFREALDKDIVDPDSVIYDTSTGRPISVRQAVDRGLIDANSGRIKDPKTGKSIDVKQAAKMGLLAIVGAPVLAGMAVVESVKRAIGDRQGVEKEPRGKSPTQTEQFLIAERKSEDRKIPKIIEPVEEEVVEDVEHDDVVFKRPKPKEVLISYERMTVVDAIASKKIEPKICRILVDGVEMPLTVQDALEQNKIDPTDEIDVIGKTKVNLVREKPSLELAITKNLDPAELIDGGAYDPQTGHFLDPDTGDPISFERFVYTLEIFCAPENILVRDLTKPDAYVDLREALDRPLVDRNSGYMVDPKTGRRVDFFEAVRRGYIIERQMKPRRRPPLLNLHEIIEEGALDPQTGEVTEPNTGNKFAFVDAINSGLVDPDSVSVRDPKTNEILTYSEAIETGIVDTQRGVIIHVETRTEIEFSVAFTRGYIMAGPRKPISLEATVSKGLYDPENGKVLDPTCKDQIDIQEAVTRSIIDKTISQCRDTAKTKWVPLQEALDTKLLDPETGRIKDTKQGDSISLDKAVKRGMVSTTPVKFGLIEAIVEKYYTPRNCLILDPVSGDEVSVKTSIERGLVDPSEVKIRDPVKDRTTSFAEAVDAGVVDPVRGKLTDPEMTLDVAYEKGYIVNAKRPWSLQEALAQGLYDPKTDRFKIDGADVDLAEAIRVGAINASAVTVKDPTGASALLSLDESIARGLVDPASCRAYDPVAGTEMNLLEALERGLIVPHKRRFSLPEAVFKGYYDPASGKFLTAETDERIATDRAIRRGILDPNSTIVCIDGQILTFSQAVEDGVVDPQKGMLVGSDRLYDFNEAFERGLMLEVRKPMSLSEALAKSIFDEASGTFLDPNSGDHVDLKTAIETKLIDSDSVYVKDTRAGTWKKVSLPEALRLGYVDGVRGTVKDFSKSGEVIEYSLPEAFEKGLIVDSKAAVSLQRAIHQGLYDDKSGKFSDPSSGRQITLHEAIRRYIVNPLLVCYWDAKGEKLLNLVETCRMGIIDRRTGSFREPGSNVMITLTDAMSLGLILDIETANFGLYETVTMGIYNPDTRVLTHPASGRKLSLQESVKEDLVNPENSIIKNLKTGKYLKLPDAISEGLIDDISGTYRIPNGRMIDLLEARNRGLIVTAQRPLSLENAIKNCLYRPDTGKFVDPKTGEYFDLVSGIESGLLDPDSTALKDPTTNQLRALPVAIESGDIDVPKGRVLDTKSKRAFNLDAAFEKGLLVSLERPVTGYPRPGSVDVTRTPKDLRSVREYSLEEAIRFELIDPDRSVVKDPQSGVFRVLRRAIRDGLVDLERRAVFDPKSKSASVALDSGVVVYFREPFSFERALESGHLSVATGKFTDPVGGEVLSIKDAVASGLIDPDTALVKDGTKKRLVKLPEAFRKGLMDPEKGNVLDTTTSKLHTMAQALDAGLLMTPKRGFSLIEGLVFGLYNPTTGGFTDPFSVAPIIDRKRLNLLEAIERGLIDPSTTVVKDSESGAIEPLLTAVGRRDDDDDGGARILDPVAGRLVDRATGKELDLIKAHERGLILPAEARQAVEEKYKLCDETLTKLLEWVSRVESTLASQQVVREHEEELRNQINTMRQLKDELDSHGHAVSQCADQVRQLVLTAGDVLSKDEVGTLEKSGRSLKQRYDRCCDKAERLLRRLASARDELTKFRNELSVFSGWLTKARRTLEEKERSVSDLGKLSSSAESTREFVSDVIAHKADLRFITMAGQKFIDESKEYLTVLNDFRTSLPQRLHHVEPVPSHESAVSQDVSVATQQYRDLLGRANALSDRMSGVGGRQRDYSDAVDKAKRWLREVEPRCNKILSEPVGAEPKIVEDQLNRAKSLNAEFVAQGRLVDNAVQAVGSLLRSLEGQLSPTEISQLEQPVTDLENKYKQLSEALAEKCRELDTALVQSQGVQDALDGLVNWLNQAENQFKSQQRPASLNKDRLDEQLHEQRILQSDIDSHRASLDSISISANDLLATASNARVAKKIESKLADVKSRFDKLLDKSLKRGEFLEEVHVSLTTFTVQVQQFEHWYVEVMESVESRDLTKLPVEEYAIRMQELTNRRDDQSLQFEDTVLKGRTLVGKKDVTDTVPVRDKIKSIETQWKDLNTLLDEKHKLSKQRTEQMTAYERLRDQVVVWLTSTETRVSRLEPVAVDVDTLKRQIEELKPIAKEYRDYGPTIDKLNDLGNVYDALLRGDRPESPGRRRSQAYSPTKRTSVTASPLRRMSQDGRSPSPTKTYQLTSPVSPGGSSGFSSRRSSQDGFHLEEMSPVQQQLSEINNRYSLLGVRITDRQTELDSTRDELKKHVDALRTLSSFLDKINRQMPKDNVVPASKDDAEKMSKQYKSIVEEMYEKQSLLDSTRSQVKDLLRRKPGALGADRLESDVDDVIVRWKTASDRCKDRIRFLDDIKDMHDTHDGLNGWLNAKERMMTVLGPISSDPRMVQSQVQQVQVLREEFRSQQPQLDHLNAVGDQVLARIPATVPDGQKISDKLSTVRAKWNDLLTKLDGRAESLGAAADTSREFDAGLNRLKDALQGISDNLDDLPMDKDPEDLLRKVENLERQLEGQRPLLADIEAAGAHLMDVLSDPASRAEIQGKLTGVGRQYTTLQKKLDHKKAEIEGSLRDGRQLEASCSKTLGWLSEELGGLSERLLVSADRVVLQQQVDHHEPIYRDVMAREHEVIMLLNKGKDVLGKSRASVEAMRPLQRDVDKIQTQWDKLKKETVDRHTRLQTCLEHCKKYYRAQETFLPWLRQAEDKLDTLRPTSYKRKHMDQRLRDLQAFRNDVWKKSGEYENNRTLGDGFLSACDVDKDVVKSELGALKQRWDKLNNDLIERTQMIEDASRRIGDFNESIRELEHGVQRCEDSLASHDALGGAAKDPKLLDRIKKLKDDAAKLKAPLSAARNAAGDLASEAGSNGVDASHLVDEVDAIGDRIEDLGAKLDDRWSELQSAAAAVTQFNDRVKMLTHDLTDLENELDAMRPAGRDVKTVRGQIDETETFMRKVSRIADSVTDIVHAGDGLVDSGFAPGDTTQTRQQVDALGRQLQKLDDRSKNRDAELHDTLDRLQNFYEVHTGILDDIEQASDELRKLRPVGSEVDSIRGQQDEFKTFRARVVEPLTQGVTECVRTGQTLVQSAASGVNTTTLEKDLEKLNERWNDLKERMNERERKLDVGLLQSGKFQEALDGFAKWLTDTEEMVANQKPPSADYKVVKAQLQEQKFLKKMLLDRQSSMSSLFTMGNEIAQGADPAERKAIERQLKELIGRFDKLTEGAQQRTLDLEQAMHVAKMFQDKVVPLQEWLDKTEKKIKDMEMVPTDEEKIQQRIREHEKVHDDILNRKPDFSELTEIASNLMSLVGEDEALGLAEKLSEVTDRYTQLVEASDNVGQLLTSSRQGLRHLVLTYQDLVAWMDSMEERLGRYRLLAVHTDKLLEQMDDLADLTEEISTRQTSVDSTVDSGLELMKHISSDEALQLKDKLDSLQRRFNDLTSRSVDLLKHAQEALPLVTQFHNSHNRLVDWMLGAESTLSHAEPREDDIARLELDIQELRPVLENINLVGPQLCQISPGDGAATIEALVTRDNRRFDALVEQIQRRAERIHLSKQRSLEVMTDIDELLDWFRDVDTQIREADPPSAEPDSIRLQLKEHKALNDDVSSQKGRARDVLSAARKVLRESSPMEDTSAIREKTEDLRETMDTVSSLSSDRLGILEQALPLAEHFRETHSGLSAWLDETERQVSALAMPALRPDAIAQQQDRNEMLVQSLNEHRPLLDKLNKTGEALIKLTDPEDGAKIQETVEIDNQRYDALRAELRGRQRALEDALQESSRFSDKLEGMLRALSGAADQVASAEPVAAHPPKIKGQIEENCALAGDLEEREEAYNAVKRAADDVINKAGDRQDPAIKDIKRKLEKLNKLWVDVQRATQDRRHTLDDALDAARKFWEELKTVMATLKELEDSLSSQEPPAVEPAAIQKQQVALQEIRHEMDQTKPEVDQVRTSGQRLMRLCGEPDKPEVKKHIEDLDHAWDNITALYAKREENLIDAMEKAMEFHETLQNLLEFLTQAEDRFEKMGALGSDIETVKKQIAQLRDFKADVDPHMVKVEALNRQAHELSERTSGSDIAAAAAIREPLGAVNARWDALTRAVVDRQRRLEHALLRLGQLQHALEELLVWIKRTDATLDELKPVAGDPQILEVELAKLKVLVNDIQAHQTSVDTLNDAGRQIIETGKGTDEASTTQDKLSTLNRQWRELLQKATDRQCELEAALREAHTFHAEIQDLLGWLAELDGVIAASKPVGGLPETASEQLERFMEVYNELEQNRAKVETVLQQGQEYLKKSSPNAASNLQHNLRTLKQRWDATTARANDKKIKLEIALKEATEFHDALQAFVDWLTNAEKILTNLKPVSRVMEIILTQIEDHKSFQKDVGAHRETMLNLDKKGTHLKYFSQKQDVILIKNLLVSVQHRWERVVSKSAERTRSLDHGYKEAREFHDAYTNLMNWLTETEKNLDELNGTETSNDPEKIKLRLSKHREFQRALSAKQTTYDGTMKAGKALKDKAPKSDEVPLKTQLTDLKNKWTTVCSKSVDRQRKLEEALLFSGQFKDAVQALLEWLTKVEKMLSEEGPVHGDLDTVMALVDQHKNFEQDLNSRGAQMESVTRTGRELEATASAADAEMIRSQLNELNGLWKRVTKLNTVRTERLEEALREAERLHKAVHMLLEWLSDAEMKLRFAGPLPDDEQESRNAIAEHSQFIRELAEKEIEKDATIDLAQRILAKSHPDGAAVIKHWITIIQSRWEEVSTWARQREERLKAHMQGLRDLDDMLEELLAWLQGLENTLTALEAEALPDDVHALETLIDDHKEFMENTANRQTEVDRVCKARQIRTQTKDASARKVSKPKTGSAAFKGSRDHLAGTRKGSRTSPARDVASHLDNLPHYGPRFPPKGSKGQEPEFKSQRVKVLWDRWRHVWVMAWERQRRLHEKLMYLQELDKVRNFSWEDWRKRFLKFMNHKKSRLTDLFRKMDKDNNGLIPREDFIDGIIKTKFDTSRLEMNAVADLFDRNNSALIDWKEFIAALRPDWEDRKPPTDADKIHDEVKRLVMLCTCRQKFRVFQVGEGKYRFGDSQKLRLVRILRSTVMVRVGGGWVALDEFLQKNDPCRAAEVLSELMPIFEKVRQREELPCAYPIQMSSGAVIYTSVSHGHIHSTQPTYHWVRERSSRSVPMGGTMPRTSRSSLSAGTPDSLSGDEGIGGSSSTPGYARPLRKGSAPVRSTPTSSRPGSKPNSRPSSRPASRTGSKPPSRHGSTLSLDSTDDATPSKIPISRKTTPASSKLGTSAAGTASARKLTVPNGSSLQRPRTPTGLQSPSTPISRSRTNSMHRASSIPTLTTTTTRSRIPVYVGPSDTASTASTGSQSISISFSGARTPTTTTPTTSTSKIQRKDSNASDSARARSNSKSEQRAPFRL